MPVKVRRLFTAQVPGNFVESAERSTCSSHRFAEWPSPTPVEPGLRKNATQNVGLEAQRPVNAPP